jgi:hypothetical protein
LTAGAIAYLAGFALVVLLSPYTSSAVKSRVLSRASTSR